MNYFTPTEFVELYSAAGAKKTLMPFLKLMLLAILSGLIISFGGAATNTATHMISNAGLAKMVSGLLFPFGLVMVILTGAELFTGNSMIIMSVIMKKAKLSDMLRNWVLVYIGNFVGSLILALGVAYFGQLNMSGGELAVYTIKVAAAKCSMPFANALVMAVFCNVLVCIGVMCAYCAKDIAGKVLGAYVPIVFFVICGFEHCIANMYYIPAGLFANSVPKYAELAANAGIDVSSLTWQNFFAGNLLPVTIGNIIGGIGFALIMWYAHEKKK